MAAAAAPPDPSLTTERFERELQALAARAQEDTWARAARRQLVVYGRAVLLLVLAAASANASVAALSPVYGAIPAGRAHAGLVAAACFVGWSANLHLRRLLPARLPLPAWLPLLAAYAPVVQALLTSRRVAPLLLRLLPARWGPLVVEAAALGPLLAAAVACVATELEAATGLDEALAAALSLRLPRWLADALPGLGSWAVFRLAERGTADVGGTGLALALAPPPPSFSSLLAAAAAWVRTRVARQLVLAGGYALAAAPRRMLLLLPALPALLHTALLNPHLAGAPWALVATNHALAADGWVVRERRESVTGYVAVLDNVVDGYRVLRCDHSLLGGEWTRFPAAPVAEPIYGVFVMLEAVRLVERGAAVPSLPPPSAPDESALVIGLGIGTAPAALVAHGIATTVVEIDPAVHDLARRYFHLPANHTAVLEDAVAYAARQAAAVDRPGFDYIVHDVFTGGAEPVALFTLEFLQNLHALLKPDGVVAINYAGNFALTPIKAVVHTIRAVFPACRIFREHPRENAGDGADGADGADDDAADFVNVVIFCVKRPGARDADIVFRPPQPADLLNSETRRRFLVPQHEVVDADFRSPEPARLVRHNDTAQLAQWHAESALGHWAVMRRVVPANVWLMW